MAVWIGSIFTDASGQPGGSIFEGQAVQKDVEGTSRSHGRYRFTGNNKVSLLRLERAHKSVIWWRFRFAGVRTSVLNLVFLEPWGYVDGFQGVLELGWGGGGIKNLFSLTCN